MRRISVTQVQLAAALGVSQPTIAKWATGVTKPTTDKRKAIFALYGIEPAAWDIETPDQPPPKNPRETVPPEIVAQVAACGAENVLAKARQLSTIAQTMLRDIEADPEATMLEKARVCASIASTLNVLARLTGDYDSGRHFLKLPIWQRITTELREALRPYPEAAQAVAERFERIEAE